MNRFICSSHKGGMSYVQDVMDYKFTTSGFKHLLNTKRRSVIFPFFPSKYNRFNPFKMSRKIYL